MNELYSLTAAREEFRRQIKAWEAAMASDDDDVKPANQLTAKTDALVSSWAAAGTVTETLLPLLEDESAHVRCAAATYLLRHDGSERALEVLQAIADNDDFGSAASTAETALMVWEKS
jgi:hypothetical protein